MDYIGVRSVLQVPPCNSQNWSDDEGDNENEKDNKTGDWSDCEQQWSEDEDGFPKITTFKNLYHKARAQMTPMTPRVMMTPRTTVATTNPAILPAMTPRSQLCVDFLDNIGFEFKLWTTQPTMMIFKHDFDDLPNAETTLRKQACDL